MYHILIFFGFIPVSSCKRYSSYLTHHNNVSEVQLSSLAAYYPRQKSSSEDFSNVLTFFALSHWWSLLQINFLKRAFFEAKSRAKCHACVTMRENSQTCVHMRRNAWKYCQNVYAFSRIFAHVYTLFLWYSLGIYYSSCLFFFILQ